MEFLSDDIKYMLIFTLTSCKEQLVVRRDPHILEGRQFNIGGAVASVATASAMT